MANKLAAFLAALSVRARHMLTLATTADADVVSTPASAATSPPHTAFASAVTNHRTQRVIATAAVRARLLAALSALYQAAAEASAHVLDTAIVAALRARHTCNEVLVTAITSTRRRIASALEVTVTRQAERLRDAIRQMAKYRAAAVHDQAERAATAKAAAMQAAAWWAPGRDRCEVVRRRKWANSHAYVTTQLRTADVLAVTCRAGRWDSDRCALSTGLGCSHPPPPSPPPHLVPCLYSCWQLYQHFVFVPRLPRVSPMPVLASLLHSRQYRGPRIPPSTTPLYRVPRCMRPDAPCSPRFSRHHCRCSCRRAPRGRHGPCAIPAGGTRTPGHCT